MHPTIPVCVIVDVDAGIAPLVAELNSHSDIRTFASCQGSNEYEPYVMVGWKTRQAFDWLTQNYNLAKLETNDPAEYTDGSAYIRLTR